MFLKMSENDLNKKMAAEFYRDIELPKPNVESQIFNRKLTNLMAQNLDLQITYIPF